LPGQGAVSEVPWSARGACAWPAPVRGRPAGHGRAGRLRMRLVRLAGPDAVNRAAAAHLGGAAHPGPRWPAQRRRLLI